MARSESDDEVIANIESDLVPVFHWQRRAFKGTAYQSRTEAFLHWCEENADEIAAWRARAAERLTRAAVRGVQRDEAQAAADTIGKPAGLACLTCPCAQAPCVRPEPSGGARLAIVGEAPGWNELQQGRPFVGASGRMLMRGLRTLGLARSDVHWSNAVLCECAPADLPKAAKACAARLAAELADAAAPVVMPVGAWALRGALGLPKRPQILKWRGSVTRHGSRLVAPTVHPAFVMRSPAWGSVLEADVARVGRLLASGFTPPEAVPGRRTVIARTRETLAECLAALRPGAAVAFDVETVGLGPTATALVCFVLSDGATTLVVPWTRGLDGREPWWGVGEPDVAAEVSAALASRVTVTHNGPAFDHIVAARYGIRIAAWDDTLLATHALASHLPKNLAHLVTQHLDVGPWKQWEHNGSVDAMWEYCALDGLYTILTWHAIRERVGA